MTEKPATVAEALAPYRDAAGWAASMGTDFRRAWRECPSARWLAHLALVLGADRKVVTECMLRHLVPQSIAALSKPLQSEFANAPPGGIRAAAARFRAVFDGLATDVRTIAEMRGWDQQHQDELFMVELRQTISIDEIAP